MDGAAAALALESKFMSRCAEATTAGTHIGIRELLAWAHDLLKEIGLDVDANLVKQTVLAAYDTHVAPFDLPYIPNLIEPVVDRAIRRALEAGLDQILAD
jgi:hypothetical protein